MDEIKYGSNEYLIELKDYIDQVLEDRKNSPYEIFMHVYQSLDKLESIHVANLSDLKDIKNHLVYKGDYSTYKVFLRHYSDNTIVLLAKKDKTSLLEVTEHYFTICS
jgi:hypothetical protein